MTLTREHALQALESAKLNIAYYGVSRGTKYELFEGTEQLDANQKQLCLAEAATRTFLYFLVARSPLYEEFEDLVWRHFLELSDLHKEIDSLIYCQEYPSAAFTKYYDFIRGMFEKSGKSRHEFYADMLFEAKIEVGPEDIAFGAVALAFREKAMVSMHREHLLVFYSVELLIRAHAAAHPRGSPLSDARLETFYKHFEAAIPVRNTFKAYTKDDSLFLYSAKHWLLPSID